MSISDKQLCEICNKVFKNLSLYESHTQGKKHRQNADKKQEIEDLERKSVFLSFKEVPNFEILRDRLSEFGEIDRIVYKKNDKDNNNARFLFVEYRNQDSAKRLLDLGTKMQIGDDEVSVEKRKVNFDADTPSTSLEREEIIEELKACVGYNAQLERLLDTFGITQKMKVKREKICAKLTNFMQRYFADPITLVLFGSSCTGLGTKRADADVCFTYQDKLNGDVPMEYCPFEELPKDFRFTYSITNSPDINEFIDKPVTKDEMCRMFPADQAKLLTRLIIAYRSEYGKIGSVHGISYARKPIVQFRYNKDTLFELSILNLLGQVKANFVGNVVAQDTTGVMKKFIFGLRLWAELHGLYEELKDGPGGVFKSYALSLFAVSFLQQAGYIGSVNTTGNRIMDRWNIEYEVLLLKEFVAEDLPKLFRNFFVFTTNTINEHKVHSVKDAKIYTTEEFEELHVKTNKCIEESFAFGEFNIQDPIELSHNVGAHIKTYYLKRIRQKAMLSLFKMKKNTLDFTEILQLSVSQSQKGSIKSGEKIRSTMTIEFPEPVNYGQVSRAVNYIMETVLRFTPIYMPTKKRVRTEDDSIRPPVRYTATFKVWVGRRPIKRRFQNMSEYKDLSELELEHYVSDELQRTAPFTEDLVDFQMTLKLTGNTLVISVDLNEGLEQDKNVMLHWLETFFRKHLPKEADPEEPSMEVDNVDERQ